MSVDRPESYLTNLDIQIRVNDSGVSVTYGGAAADRDADQDFVREVAYASGAAMAEIVNTRQGSSVIDPDLLQNRRGMTLGEEVHFTIPAPVEHDPLVIAAKEITKPAADIAPVVIGKEPAQRNFDLPPQHIIDAKTITVTETPIGPDGVQLGPVEKTMVRVSDGIVLPTPDVLIAEQNSFQENVKSLNISTSEIIRQCQDELSRAIELFPLLTQSYVDSFSLDQKPEELAQSNQLTLFYLEQIAGNLNFLNTICRPYLTAEETRQIDIIDRNVTSIYDLLGIEPEPSTLDRIRV